MGQEIAWESSRDWVGCYGEEKKKILNGRSLSGEQEDLAQREAGYSAKKKNQILMEKGRLLGGEQEELARREAGYSAKKKK
ncbi:hypothetical protein SLEP1_g14742 [Rubroshorea leprosula]|uniref:Uncharacterized protein n=1 Tax=Rubroshorea leprosula TaxID=152421 RepID=A0AAV5IUL3_9ROSI|nr:hypothetical protein SLEP1_g14742 [Rubroshorea leprosula]